MIEDKSSQTSDIDEETEASLDSGSPSAPSMTPLFVLAGQSNAEGNVRLAGLEAIQDALPAHTDPLTHAQRENVRQAYQQGIGDWCNPEEDYSVEAADTAIDALRASPLDLSMVSQEYTVAGSAMAAYRWRYQDATEDLEEPYYNPSPETPPGHSTGIHPLGLGFGVWDDEETDVLFYGPELGFGLYLDQSEDLASFDFLKVAMGGSSLSTHWSPEGPMLAQLYEKTDHFLSQRNDSTVAGLIWFQGFNDQFEEQDRENYATNLTSLINTFRQTYGESIPVVIVQARKVHDLTIIADAQQTVANDLENTLLVESDGLSDCFHYDAVSQLVIGSRSAQAMMTLWKE